MNSPERFGLTFSRHYCLSALHEPPPPPPPKVYVPKISVPHGLIVPVKASVLLHVVHVTSIVTVSPLTVPVIVAGPEGEDERIDARLDRKPVKIGDGYRIYELGP